MDEVCQELFAVVASLMFPSLSYCHFGKRHTLHPNGTGARNQRALTLMFVHCIIRTTQFDLVFSFLSEPP